MEHKILSDLLKLFEQSEELLLADIEQDIGYSSAYLCQCIEQLNTLEALIKYTSPDKIRLLHSVDILKPNHILQSLHEDVRGKIARLDYFTSLSSTNDYLKKTSLHPTQALICLAEHQSAGRGRRGKSWVSPFAKNIYLSLACRCHISMNQLGLVSLVVGLALADAIAAMSVDDIYLKWPNDIYYKDQKLAGILIDAETIQAQYADLIIGIGLNVHMNSDNAEPIDQAWVSLHKITDNFSSRSQVVAQLLNKIIRNLQTLESEGFEHFAHKWRDYDYLYGKRVNVNRADSLLQGVAHGINEKGELLLLVGNKQHAVNAGEVSVCLQQGIY